MYSTAQATSSCIAENGLFSIALTFYFKIIILVSEILKIQKNTRSSKDEFIFTNVKHFGF